MHVQERVHFEFKEEIRDKFERRMDLPTNPLVITQ
jgi:hypothetical protein